MKGITHTRLVIYGLIAGLLPLIFVLSNHFTATAKCEQLDLALDLASQTARTKNAREFVNKQVKAKYRDTDHFYIDKQLETIHPLQGEIELLSKVLAHGYHPDEEQIKRRVMQLTNGQNNLSVVEGSVKTHADFQETQESLAHPVEVDLKDLKTIISRLEGVSLDDEEPVPGRPHLIITEMKVEKKRGIAQEIYYLDLKFIKREYLK